MELVKDNFYFHADQYNFFEWKILLKKVPLTYWEKVEINKKDLKEGFTEKVILLLNKHNIPYEIK